MLKNTVEAFMEDNCGIDSDEYDRDDPDCPFKDIKAAIVGACVKKRAELEAAFNHIQERYDFFKQIRGAKVYPSNITSVYHEEALPMRLFGMYHQKRKYENSPASEINVDSFLTNEDIEELNAKAASYAPEYTETMGSYGPVSDGMIFHD